MIIEIEFNVIDMILVVMSASYDSKIFDDDENKIVLDLNVIEIILELMPRYSNSKIFDNDENEIICDLNVVDRILQVMPRSLKSKILDYSVVVVCLFISAGCQCFFNNIYRMVIDLLCSRKG